MLTLDDLNDDETDMQPVNTDNRHMQFYVIMGLLLVFMWTFSLVLNVATASKLNKLIAFGSPTASSSTIKSLLDTMAAAFATFWYPFVNLGLSINFAVRVNKIA